MRHVNKILTNISKYKAVVAVALVFALGALAMPTQPASAALSADQAKGSFGLSAVGDQAALGGTLGNKGLVETITGIIKIGSLAQQTGAGADAATLEAP